MAADPVVPNPSVKKEKFHAYPAWAPRFWHGMTLGVWAKLLWKNGFRVSWQRLPTAVAITIMATVNSLLSFVQTLVYTTKINHQGELTPPIFIIGHWRERYDFAA